MAYRYCLWLLLWVLLASCRKETLFEAQVNDHFFLENEGAQMPVLVSGNTASRTFILVLHGGPGGSAIRDYYNAGLFSDLEKEYALLYWDQRCAGISQGNCSPDQLSVAAYTADLEKLLQLIRHRFGPQLSLFLMGHSWGGTLGLSYLVRPEHQDGINGFINVDGPHSFPFTMEAERAYLMQFAGRMITAHIRTADWQKIHDQAAAADPGNFKEAETLNSLAYSTQQLLIAMDSVASPSVGISPGRFLSGLLPGLANGVRSQFVYGSETFLAHDITDALRQIQIPVLQLWGRYDFVIPPAVALQIHQQLGSQNKELYFFERSHHSPMFHEKELFQSRVDDFVKQYKNQ